MVLSLIVGILMLAIALVAAVIVGRNIARPIVRFSAATSQIRDLDISRIERLRGSVFRELNEQSIAFNAMLRALQWFELYVPKKIVERLIKSGDVRLPPLFIDHLVHAILRNILDDKATALQVRAAELFFRAQRISIQEGQVLAADEETVTNFAAAGGEFSLARLVAEGEDTPRQIELDVLDEANQDAYWPRSERFDMVHDLTFARPGLDALCRVMEKWIDHFLTLATRIHPVQSIRDERWRWHCGLDTTSSTLLNALYRGETLDDDRLRLLVGLFRLEIKNGAAVIPEMIGRPVYLGLAMDEASVLRMKPQNLLVNLPLVAAA